MHVRRVGGKSEREEAAENECGSVSYMILESFYIEIIERLDVKRGNSIWMNAISIAYLHLGQL